MVAKVERSPKVNGTHKENKIIIPEQSLQESRLQELVQEPFPYGWRIEEAIGPDGKVVINYLPIPQERFLDPQEGDHFMQSNKHYLLVESIFARFDKRYMNDDRIGVYSDLKFDWGIPGLSQPAPDLAIVPNLRNADKYHSRFKIVQEETRPCLVVEVASPNYPFDDTTKVDIYARAGVQEYIIVNPHFEEDQPFELIGYRLVQGTYEPIAPDEAGRLYSATTNVWFGLDEDERDLVIEDGDTGEPLLDNREEREARLRAEKQAEAELQRAETEFRRAESEAQRAESEAQARRAAEQRAGEAEAELARLRTMFAQRFTSN